MARLMQLNCYCTQHVALLLLLLACGGSMWPHHVSCGISGGISGDFDDAASLPVQLSRALESTKSMDSAASHQQAPTMQDEWKGYYDHICALHISGQSLCGLVGPLMQWKFELAPTQLKRATAHVGPNQRLRRVVRDLLTGRSPINVGVIGTSVSFGTGPLTGPTTHVHACLCVCMRACVPLTIYARGFPDDKQ